MHPFTFEESDRVWTFLTTRVKNHDRNQQACSRFLSNKFDKPTTIYTLMSQVRSKRRLIARKYIISLRNVVWNAERYLDRVPQ